MKRLLIAGLVCALSLMWQPCAKAKDKTGTGHKEKDSAAQEGQDNKKASENQGKVKGVLTSDERSTIQTYVRGFDNPKKLPPGLAKKVARGRGLPPGWQKKVTPGEIMPASVFERCQPLPPELVIKLPPSPVGTVTVAIGGKVARVLEATREILDVFDVHAPF